MTWLRDRRLVPPLEDRPVMFWPWPREHDRYVFGDWHPRGAPVNGYDGWHYCPVHDGVSWRGSSGCFACEPRENLTDCS